MHQFLIYLKLIFPRKRFFTLMLLLGFSTLMVAQTTISGKVTSDDNTEGLPGVNVVVKGTATGTITDQFGVYEISNLGEDAVLVFSFIGYGEQEIAIAGKNTIDVHLKSVENILNEVVVLGYSEKSKTEISSAVSSLDMEEIDKVTVNNVEDMLVGKVAGVQVQSASGQPGEAAQIRIRGVGSAFSPQSPLIVVDGIIGASYNPSDIESVSILRDAAATGLYGSQAAAGVIVIKTRSGSTEKPVFTAKVLRGIKQASVGNYQVMNADELWEYHKSVFDPNVFNSLRPSSLRKQDYDWIANSFSQADVQRYYLSASAKKDKFSYFISGDYFDDEGTALGSDYKRLTLNTKISYQMTERLKITTRVFGQTFNASYPHWTFTESPFRMMPWDNPFDAEGNAVKDIGDWYSNVPNNIFHSSEYNNYTGEGSSFEGDLWLDFQIFDWLSLSSQNVVGSGYGKYAEVESPLSLEGGPVSGRIGNSVNFSKSIGTTNLLRFSHNFDIHSISGFAGMEAGSYIEEFNIGGSGIGIFPGQEILSAAGTTTASGNKRESRGFSVLSQVNYNFNKKYFATASFRRDGSSKFGPSNRYANFYTAAASWLLSNEDFMAPLKDKIHYLKLRASYGAVGNETFPNNTFYPYFPSYSFIYQYNNNSAAFPVNLGNPSLSWESSFPANVGIDIGLFNRFEINIDAYHTVTKNLLFQDPTAYSKGFQFQWKNVGSIQNQGIELTLSGDVIRSEDFQWNLGLNLAANQNKMLKLSDKEVDQIQISANDIYQVFREGEVPFAWFMPKWLGVNPDKGDPQWETIEYDENGNETGRGITSSYSEATFQPVGSPFPDFTGGLSTLVAWKGLSLQVTTSFVYGNDIYFATRKEIDNDGANNNVNAIKLADDESRWQQPGDIATHPKAKQGGNKNAHEHSSRYMEDGSYFRIRNATLSYELPYAWVNRIGLEQFKLRISADNLYTLTNFSGMDPDVPLYRSSSYDMPGLSSFKYPISQQYLIGLEIKF
jgi:TonB-linked SusC/RagA family outer membrane protein